MVGFPVQVAEWREEGKASIIPGVLFIDEVTAYTIAWYDVFPCFNSCSTLTVVHFLVVYLYDAYADVRC